MKITHQFSTVDIVLRQQNRNNIHRKCLLLLSSRPGHPALRSAQPAQKSK